MEAEMRKPILVASTGARYSCSIAESLSRERHDENSGEEHAPMVTKEGLEPVTETNYFKSIQWSPDGTTLFTNSADNTIRSFIAPTDLLSEHASPLTLQPYTSISCPEPVYALTPYPYFTLSDPSTTLLLTSIRDHPTRLTNILDSTSSIISTYPLISPTTEAYQTPSSMIFTPTGTSFLTGTSCLISLFDISQSGSGPITTLPTIPSKRHKMKGGGVGMRGIVSALSLQPNAPDGGAAMLAAGTWTRWVGLYDAEGMGGTVANWSIESAADSEAKVGGAGVSQVLWSACGRYLFVIERQSRGVLVYDVRVTGRLVAWCEGRAAETNQRMGVDVFDGEQGSEIWCPGTDGVVKVWEGMGMSEGAIENSWEWNAHEDAVSGVAVHPGGSVVATSSGQRKELCVSADVASEDSDSSDDSSSQDEDEDEDEESKSDATSNGSKRGAGHTRKPDNSIKIWSLL